MSSNSTLFFAILISALATFGLRAFPFVLIKIAHRYDNLFRYLGAVMPPGIMTILTIYCVVNLYWHTPLKAIVSLLALLVVMILEHLRRQPILSICTGLTIYVIGQSLVAGSLH